MTKKKDDMWEPFRVIKRRENAPIEWQITKLQIEAAENPWKAEQNELEIERLRIQLAEHGQ